VFSLGIALFHWSRTTDGSPGNCDPLTVRRVKGNGIGQDQSGRHSAGTSKKGG
jgi:hypothetical protein